MSMRSKHRSRAMACTANASLLCIALLASLHAGGINTYQKPHYTIPESTCITAVLTRY